MRKLVLLAAVAVLVPVAAGDVEPQVAVESVSPQPSEPGDTVRMHVVASNEGSTTTTFAPVDVETVDGITVIGTTDAIGTRFTLCGGCQRTGTIRLKVDEEAVSGTYPVDVQLATPDGDGVVETAELEVDGTPNLVVDTSAFTIVPGGNTTTDVRVTNIGTDTATQTVLRLDEQSFSMHPSTLTLGRVAPGETVTTPVTFTADSQFSNGIEQLDLTLDYTDESETSSTTSTVAVDVLEQAEVVVADVDTGGATVGEQGTVTLTLENLGPGEAERIVSELSCGGTATVLSGRSFVGQLDDEENVPVTFTVTPEQHRPSCEVSVSYSDADDQRITESFTFAAAEQPTSPVLLGLAAAAVIAAALYWRRTRRQDELAEV